MTVELSPGEQRTGQRMRADPIFFVQHVLGKSPWGIQREIIESVRDNPRTAIRSNSASGKSWTAAVVAIWFLYTNYPSTVITTAPTWRQVRDILWREIAGLHNGAQYELGGQLTQTGIQIPSMRGVPVSDWFAIGLSTDEVERFQGYHSMNMLVIVDEASGVAEEIFQAVENPLASGRTRLLLLGNPTKPSGTFYEAFQSDLYTRFHISAFDTPNFVEFGITLEDMVSDAWLGKIGDRSLPFPSLITPQWVKDMLTKWGVGSWAFQCWVMGNFPDQGVDSLFKLSDIEASINRDVGIDGVHEASLDVSRYGDNETVYMERRGNRVAVIDAWSHQDTVYTAGRVARHLRGTKPKVIKIDSIGVGAGTADLLKGELTSTTVVEVNVGLPAIDTEQFANQRAELYWGLAKRFENGEISIPDDPVLKAQLCDIRYTFTPKGQLIIESKEKARARGSNSPDRADALMMLFKPGGVGRPTKVYHL